MVQFQTNVWQRFTRLVRQFLSHPVVLRRTKKEGVNGELASQARHNMDTPKFNICVAVRGVNDEWITGRAAEGENMIVANQRLAHSSAVWRSQNIVGC